MKKMKYDNKEYEKYRNNLVRFLSEHLYDMELFTQLKMLHNFEEQLQRCTDIEMREVIRIGIDIIRERIKKDTDYYIKTNQEGFEDWKRRKGLM